MTQKNVNVSLLNVKKPLINSIAKVNAGGTVQIKSSANGGETVAEAKNGASIDVIEKDVGGGYSKIWFDSKECYVKKDNLTDFHKTPSSSRRDIRSGMGKCI